MFARHSIVILLLFSFMVNVQAQTPQSQASTRPLTYEEVLTQWERSCAYGDHRDLKTFASNLNQHTGTQDYNEGLRDNPWLRIYTYTERIFGDSTDFVIIVATAFILIGAYQLWNTRLRQVFSATSPRVSDGSGPSGVGGWLLFLCVMLTIVGPIFSFAKLHEVAESQMWFGILLIMACFATGISLWSGHHIGYKVAIIYFWVMIVISCFGLLANTSADAVAGAVGTLITSGIWLAYLGCSKRVTNTYFSNNAPSQSPPSTPPVDFDDVLRKFAKLRDDGLITQDEFDTKKKELLNLGSTTTK